MRFFQCSHKKTEKIPGYTLHGNYYLANEVIPNRNWKEAIIMRKFITLPNGKMVVAHTLSKEELESIPREERKIDDKWYWTRTLYDNEHAWIMSGSGVLYSININCSIDNGGIRLGFKNPFAN